MRVRLLDGAEPDERRRVAIVRDASVAWRNREIQDRIRRAQEMTPDDADDADMENFQLVPYLPADAATSAARVAAAGETL